MDNNAAERALRGPVVGRKNYYGSGSRWSARLAAVVFSILQTRDQPATLAECLSAIPIPALGDGSGPQRTGVERPARRRLKRYCGRRFSGEEIGQLGALIADNPGRTRAQLSRLACRLLQWHKADGGLKEMSCRVAMLRMHREGLLQLPPPRNRKGGSSRITFWTAPQPLLSRPVHELPGVHLEPVLSRPDSALWNEYIDRYHYLGYTPLPGAQLRYFARWEDRILALLGFGAAAWKTAPRDRFIGWRPAERERNLQLIVNNARFLILPWVQSEPGLQAAGLGRPSTPPGLAPPLRLPARSAGNLRRHPTLHRRLLQGGQLDPCRTDPRARQTGPTRPICPPKASGLPPEQTLSDRFAQLEEHPVRHCEDYRV